MGILRVDVSSGRKGKGEMSSARRGNGGYQSGYVSMEEEEMGIF